MELNSLIKVRRDAPLLESVSEADSNIVERFGSISMTRMTKRQCSLIKLNSLIKVRRDTLLVESVSEAISKIVESHGSISMTRRAEQ
jgi:hypothetical protein